jgi:virginiamycin A acetyltransferase
MINMKNEDNSFQFFLNDYMTRCYESHDWLSEIIEARGLSDNKNIYQLSRGQLKTFRDFYDGMIAVIYGSVKIRNQNNVYDVTHVTYHKKFGWVASCDDTDFEKNELKIFLGKISLLENTSIVMGKRSYISGPSFVRGGGRFLVGSYCNLAENLKVFTGSDAHPLNHAAMMNFHGNSRLVEDGLSINLTYKELPDSTSCVEMGNDVWIGRDVSLKSGINIGDGCVIGQHSLVLDDCLPYGVYVGSPARLIRFRFPEHIIQDLSSLKWWDWPMSRIQRNERLFGTDLNSYQGDIADLVL